MAKRSKREKRKVSYGSAKKRAETHQSGFESKALKRPEGLEWFRVKAGTYRLDIIPYVVGKGNPCADEGLVYYERTFYTHRNIGANPRDQYICPMKTSNKKCPVCDYQAKLRRNPKTSKEAVKDLNTSERQIFIVKDFAEPDKGFQLWEISHHAFGKLLDARVKGEDEDEEFNKFFHLEDGLTLKVTFAEEPAGEGGSYPKAVSIDFKPRKEQYDESVLDEVPCLDELLKELSYKELSKVLDTGTDEEDEDEEDDDDDEQDGEEEEEEDEDEGDDEDEEDEDDDTDEESKGDDDDDESDDDDGDDDDEDGDTEEYLPAVGDRVKGEYKGKVRKGKVTKVNKKTKLALVAVDGKSPDRPWAVEFGDLTLLKRAESDEDEDDTDEEEEEEKPAKKKTGKKEKKAAKDDDDGDDEDDEDEDDDEIPFDDEDEGDDDDEEDEKPAKKPPKKTRSSGSD
jgi:hypothetical protein